jgi:outer membrane receptor protein involved in Fe transport
MIMMALYCSCLAQDNLIDSTFIFEADPIVVTADRYESLKLNSTSAISVVTEEELTLLPINKLSDAIETAPGLVFMHQDGLGEDPIVNTRGFYGGGEAEYMLVLIDGRPLNNLESDIINWNALPITDIKSMEILKGQSSSLYGNIALGGVLNIRTKQADHNSTKLSLWGGSYNNYRVELSFTSKDFKIYGSAKKLDGYRDHANRQNYTIGASVKLVSNRRHSIDFSLINYWTDFQVPGPLPGTTLEQNRRTSSVFYKFDTENERKHKAWIDWDWKANPKIELNLSVAGEYRQTDKISTLPLSPEYADTKDRTLNTKRFEGNTQLVMHDFFSTLNDILTLGAEGSVGGLSSDYFQFFQGGLDDYQSVSPGRGTIDAKGDGSRNTFALYLQYDLQPNSQLRVTLGGRYDWLDDAYNILLPSEPTDRWTKHEAFSPKLGLNYNYITNTSHKGNLYLNISKSFKAPTIDQLYDQRSIPSPFPPNIITLSNAFLKPQRGNGGEFGLYHTIYMNDNRMMGELSLAVYSMNMEDEIDFDLQQFKYVNIGKSRHQGLELGLKIQWLTGTNIFVNYTNQAATSQYGDSKGKYLKAVPRHVIIAGISTKLYADFAAGAIFRSHKDVYLDDQNTLMLPDYTVADLKISYKVKMQKFSTYLFFEILNIFDKKYSTTGFLDPAGTPELIYYFPAAERNFRVGLTMEL